ncbi:MAG: hypothetical protein WAV32_06555 [Halobacteriota archaeon]
MLEIKEEKVKIGNVEKGEVEEVIMKSGLRKEADATKIYSKEA